MSDVIVIGSDEHGLTELINQTVLSATHLPGEPIGADLVEAGIEAASALVITNASLATTVSVAKERNDGLTVVFYSRGRLPPYASRQADLAIDPALVDPDEVVDAVVDRLTTTG